MLQALIALLVVGGGRATLSHPDAESSEFRSALYAACIRDPVCRSVHQQEHGALSQEHFERLTDPLRAEVHALLDTEDSPLGERAAVLHLIVQNTYLAERRCSPNKYMHWDAASGEAECRCYIDRDCDIFVHGICEDNVHTFLLVSVGILLLGVLTFVVMLAASPPAPPLPRQRHDKAAV